MKLEQIRQEIGHDIYEIELIRAKNRYYRLTELGVDLPRRDEYVRLALQKYYNEERRKVR